MDESELDEVITEVQEGPETGAEADADKPKKRMFKGTEVTAGAPAHELKGKPFQPFWQTIKPTRDQWGTIPRQKLPPIGVIKEVHPSGYGAGSVNIVVANPRTQFSPYTYVVPRTQRLNLLTGRLGRQIMEEMVAYEKLNIGAHITWDYYTSGCDPEIFVVGGDGELMPAFAFLPSKKDPLIVAPGLSDGSTHAYWDGFQAEFDTAANTCCGHLSNSVQFGLKWVLDAARKKDPKAKLSIQNVFMVPAEQLANGAEEHVEFGCAPSFNAYGHSGDKTHGRLVPYRFAGGHIHLGNRGLTAMSTKKDIERIITAMDAIIGVASVSLFAKFDNPIRRKYYGLAGEYRMPSHGLEYRVLSNAWLMHPFIYNLVFDVARRAANVGRQGKLSGWTGTPEETCDIINNCDVAGARKVLERNKGQFLSLMRTIPSWLSKPGQAERMFQVFMEGAESVVRSPEDIAGNWALDSYWARNCGNSGATIYSAMQYLTKKGGMV